MINLTEYHLGIPAAIARAFARNRKVDDNTLDEWVAICSLELIQAARTYNPSFGTLPETHLIGRTRYRLIQYLWQQKRRPQCARSINLADHADAERSALVDVIDLYNAVLGILSDQERIAVTHCYRDGLDHQEAARRMGIKRDAVRHLLTRARKKAREAAPSLLGEVASPRRSKPVDESLLAQLSRGGVRTTDLARRFRVDVSTIRAWQTRLGLPPNPPGRPRKEAP